MKKQIAAFLTFVVLFLSLSACGAKGNYRTEDYLGKTSSQIEAEYGAFDCCGMPRGEDGLYRNTACGYTIREPKRGFLGTDPEWLVFICFDGNGVAHDIYEGYRPGG